MSPAFCVRCSLRSRRLALVSCCLPHSLADEKACLLAHSSRTAARQPGSARRRAIRSLIAPLAGARCGRRLAPLAAIFAGEPPSSSSPTKQLCEKSALLSTGFVGCSCRSAARTSRARIALGRRLLRHRSPTKSASAHSCVHCSLRSLRLALVSSCLPHSLADEKACLLAHSSRTAARQPGSARRRAIRCLIASAPLRRGSRVQPAYFVVVRRQKARRLTPPQHGGARSGPGFRWESVEPGPLARSRRSGRGSRSAPRLPP